MFKEICITPQVFSSENITDSNWKDVKNLLEALSNSGFIVGLNNKEWLRTVLDNINLLPTDFRGPFLKVMVILKDRERIVGHPNQGQSGGAGEDSWLQVATQLNAICPFYKIIATANHYDQTLSIEELEEINISDMFGITGSHHYLKNTENLTHVLRPFLSYAKKLTIIDPYLYLHLPRNKESLRLIAQEFRSRRGEREAGKIVIHCRWEDRPNKRETKYYIKEWQVFLQEFSKESPHEIEVNGWKGEENSQKLHDRYLITNQGGLVSAAGTDKDDFQQSEWSMKDYNETSQILLQYDENSSPFSLKCCVSVDNIETFD